MLAWQVEPVPQALLMQQGWPGAPQAWHLLSPLWQMLLVLQVLPGQQGWPADPQATQDVPWQSAFDPQVLLAQHACPTPPQVTQVPPLPQMSVDPVHAAPGQQI
jgi:hypothetical protein